MPTINHLNNGTPNTICPQLKDEFYNVLKEELDKRQSLESKTHKPCPKLTASLITPKRIRTNLLSDCYDLGPSVDAISNDETEIEKYIKTCFTFD
ncbi:unnamed protein product [Rotaria sp. Silwood2]|nr:unnamed protein product [Rotaria sp. Silwood2]